MYLLIVTWKLKYVNWNSSKKVDCRVLIETAEADFGNFLIEFLCEFEGICETALARESGL
jgi:hypothetical protein